ncbi:MAG: hypothetical protein RR288_03415, partial [Oscillibacter sp.]
MDGYKQIVNKGWRIFKQSVSPGFGGETDGKRDRKTARPERPRQGKKQDCFPASADRIHSF